MITKLRCNTFDPFHRMYFKTLRDKIEGDGVVITGQMADIIVRKEDIGTFDNVNERSTFKGGYLAKIYSKISRYNSKPVVLSNTFRITADKVAVLILGHIKKVHTLNEYGLPVKTESTYKHDPSRNSTKTYTYLMENGMPTRITETKHTKKTGTATYTTVITHLVEGDNESYMSRCLYTGEEKCIIHFNNVK